MRTKAPTRNCTHTDAHIHTAVDPLVQTQWTTTMDSSNCSTRGCSSALHVYRIQELESNTKGKVKDVPVETPKSEYNIIEIMNQIDSYTGP